MSKAFDTGWAVVKAPWYYHATPKENLMPILREGIKSNFGEVYASKDPEIARRWVSFGRMGSPEIATVPFWRDEGDPRMQPGMDHSPMMLSLLGLNPDEVSADASWVSNENIPPEDLLPQMEAKGTPSNEDRSAGNPGIMTYPNPMYNEGFAEQMRIAQEANQKLRDEMGDENAE